MLSGGSFASWSLTWAANTVTVQVSPAAKSVAGSRTKVDGPPEAVDACDPEELQLMSYQVPPTVTASENVTVMLASRATPAAPAAGDVEATFGAASPALRG